MPVLVLVLCWLVGTAGAAGLRFSTVIIDPGHGGHDRGGIPGQAVSEKTVALDTAIRLEKVLRRMGFRTVMTRRSDVFIPLSQRVKIASRHRNAIFVSVHYNSARREGAKGYETFYYHPRSRVLAERIQARLLTVRRTENRGVKHRGFYVLRNNPLPAVLVECGFLTNREEARLALNATYRQRVAEAVARGIVDARARR